MANPGEGFNMVGIMEALRNSGFSDLVDRCTQTKNRNRESRLDLERARIQALDEGNAEIVDDIDVLTAWTLGWDSMLRKYMEERTAAHFAREKAVKRAKPKKKSEKEAIDWNSQKGMSLRSGQHNIP